MTLNASELLTRVRERIHDRNALSFDDSEILRVSDDALRQVYTALRAHGDSALLDSVDIPIASLTLAATGVYRYEPPEAIGDIQMIEALLTDANTRQIPRAALEEKDIARGVFASYGMAWIPSAQGTIEVRGSLQSFQGLRIWFVRRIPPMVTLVATTGTTTTIVPSSTVGAWKLRDDAYTGFQFECTSGSGNIGQVRRCTSFVSGTLTTAAWPSATTGHSFAMVLPLADEHAEYLTALVTMKLLRRQGTQEELAMLAGEVQQLQLEFERGIARPSSGEPPRFHSSRRNWQ